MDLKKAYYVDVTGIIVKDGKYLITKRAPHKTAFPNKWTVPGGKLEPQDYEDEKSDTNEGHWYNICENTLRREVMEETGLKIKNIKYLTSLVFRRPDGIPVVVISLFADYDKGDIKLCPDSTEHVWITLEEAKNYDLIDGIYEEIEMLDKHLKGNSVDEWKKPE